MGRTRTASEGPAVASVQSMALSRGTAANPSRRWVVSTQWLQKQIWAERPSRQLPSTGVSGGARVLVLRQLSLSLSSHPDVGPDAGPARIQRPQCCQQERS